ncbi:MAG: metallophosphoesterase [Deltaproteobacteria bacterium]|nr:metallophosphoesterase [Deltaproteobacteria bacterium]
MPRNGVAVVAHISDLHPTGVARPTPWDLLGKRALGWANLAFLRRHRHPFALLERTVADLRGEPPDHLLLGGDVANLGLPAEFAASRAVLAASGLPPERISAVPGNHDRYTADVERRRLFETYFGVFAASEAPFGDGLFPFLQPRDGFTVLGLCSGWPASPIQARGTIGDRQLVRLRELLAHPRARPPLLVVLHHPPLPYESALEQWLNGLHDWRELLGLLAGTGATVLHGHRHLSLHALVETDRGPLRVLGVPSTSDRGGRNERSGGYHRYRIGPDGFAGGERRIWNDARGAFDVRDLPAPVRVTLKEVPR